MTKQDKIASCLSLDAQGVKLYVKARPGTARAMPPRLVPLSDTQWAVEIAVQAPPEDGKANKALCAALAGYLGCNKKDISLVRGGQAREKGFLITSPTPSSLYETVESWLIDKVAEKT